MAHSATRRIAGTLSLAPMATPRDDGPLWDPIKTQPLIENNLAFAQHFAQAAACDDLLQRQANLGAAIARTRRALSLLKRAAGETRDQRREG